MDIEDRGGSDANYPRFSEDQFFDMGMLEILYNFSLKLIWTVKWPYWYAGGIFQAMKVNGILKSQDKNNDGYVDYFEFSKAQEERNAKTENQT